MKENANDFIKELIAEMNEYHRRLTPEQKKEVDVQRAYHIIRGIGFADNVPPRIAEIYRAWLIENFEREHVQEAMERLFNDYCREM